LLDVVKIKKMPAYLTSIISIVVKISRLPYQTPGANAILLRCVMNNKRSASTG